MYYVLDTHIIVWFLEGGSKLGTKSKEILKSEDTLLIIPSITLAEIKHLNLSGRININLEEVITTLESDPRCTIYPLDLSVIENLPKTLDIHDGIICATAIVYRDILQEKVCLLTKDEAIIKSNLVETIF